MKIDKQHLQTLMYFLLLSILGATWLMWHSYSTTPLLPSNFGNDAAVFHVVGKSWSLGLIPYKDIFDHKGPLLYLVYMLGYKISSLKGGVFLIQCLLFSLTLFSFFKIASLFVNEKTSLFFVCITLLVFGRCIDEGALTEEFSLPALSISLYFMLRWFLNCYSDDAKGIKHCHHPYQWAFLYGFMIMCIAFIRLNNAIGLFCFLLVIVLRLVVNKEFVNILHNAVAFLLGAAIVTLPICYYFYINHALPDMINGVFYFNFRYLSLTSQVTHSASQWQEIILYLAPLWLLAFVSLWFCIRRDAWIGGACLFCCGVSFYVLTQGSFYPHYYIVCIPFLLIALGLFQKLTVNWKYPWERFCAWLVSLVIVVVCMLSIQSSVDRIKWIYSAFANRSVPEFVSASRAISSHIPQDERNRVIGYNLDNNDTAWYLVTNITPCGRIFGLNEWFAEVDPVIKVESENFLLSGKPKWVVVMRNGYTNNRIRQILTEDYVLYTTQHLETTNRNMDLYAHK